MVCRIWNNSLFGFRPPSLFNIILKCNTYGNADASALALESAAVRLLMWVRIPPGKWMSVFCECWLLSGRSLRDVPITHPEEPYRLWRVTVWSRNFKNEAALARFGLLRKRRRRRRRRRRFWKQDLSPSRVRDVHTHRTCYFIPLVETGKYIK